MGDGRLAIGAGVPVAMQKPFRLETRRASIPWQGDYVSLAVCVGHHKIALIQTTEQELRAMRGFTYPIEDTTGVPVIAAVYDENLELYPTPDAPYLIKPI